VTRYHPISTPQVNVKIEKKIERILLLNAENPTKRTNIPNTSRGKDETHDRGTPIMTVSGTS
tara:strand:- start:97 stop:282 length:186 start_codon:yes stop_codon:yes gene_type:complete